MRGEGLVVARGADNVAVFKALVLGDAEVGRDRSIGGQLEPRGERQVPLAGGIVDFALFNLLRRFFLGIVPFGRRCAGFFQASLAVVHNDNLLVRGADGEFYRTNRNRKGFGRAGQGVGERRRSGAG